MDLSIVSWNTGERIRWGCRSWTPDASLGDIARRLEGWNPDLAVLQELRSKAQLEVVLERLGAGWHGRLTHMPKSDRQVAIISRIAPKALVFEEIATRVGRTALHARWSPVGAWGGAPLHVVGCHGNAFSATFRRRYFDDVLDHVDRAIPPDEAVLLIGDFNIDPWLAWLTQDRFVLRRLALGWRRLLSGRWRTCLSLLHLDHAFLRPPAAVEAEATVLQGTRAYGRDHEPVRVVLRPRPAPPPSH